MPSVLELRALYKVRQSALFVLELYQHEVSLHTYIRSDHVRESINRTVQCNCTKEKYKENKVGECGTEVDDLKQTNYYW